MKIRTATNHDCSSIQNLVFRVLKEYGIEPDPQGTDSDLFDIEGSYLAINGDFEVLIDEDAQDILGTIGFIPLDKKTCELRKNVPRPPYSRPRFWQNAFKSAYRTRKRIEI